MTGVLPLRFRLTNISAYTGIVATRAQVNSLGTFDTTNKQMNARSSHIARSNISSLQIMASNFYVDQTTRLETSPGSSATIKASIEYPAGTFTQILFSGSASGTIADGSTLLSDSVTVSIPSGAQFWVRQFITSTAGAIYNNSAGATSDSMEVAVSGLTDKTMSGTITGNSGMHYPMAIVATMTAPSVCIVGDSIAWGSADSYTTDGDLGMIARVIGPLYGYGSVAVPSDFAREFVTSHTQRAKVFPYCSHFIVEYSTNDFEGGRSVAQVQGDLTTIYGLFGSQTGFQTTCLPRCTTTDSGATTGGQTPHSWESSRVTFNHALTGGSFGPNGGAFDTSSIVETSTDSGIWKVSPSKWTADCIHPIAFGAGQIASSGVIDTSRIHRP